MSAKIDDEEEEITVVVSADYLADLTQDPTTPFEPVESVETTPFERVDAQECSSTHLGDGVWLSAKYMQRITDALRTERERRLGRRFA